MLIAVAWIVAGCTSKPLPTPTKPDHSADESVPTPPCGTTSPGDATCEPGPDGEVFEGCIVVDSHGNRTCVGTETLPELCLREFGGTCPSFRELVELVGWDDGRPETAMFPQRCSGAAPFQLDTIEVIGASSGQSYSEYGIWRFDACGELRKVYRNHLGYPAPPWNDDLGVWCCGGQWTQEVVWGATELLGEDCEWIDQATFEADPTLGTCGR